MAFPTLAAPKSLLAVHRQLSPTAGVKVSPLCLGGMSFGTAWGGWLGSCDKKASFEILDYFYEHGGNFIDTANNYQNEESETWIGEWMKERANRDEMVIATKYTTGYQAYKGRTIIQSNFGGMNTKSLKHSLEASLKKLQTTYLDVLYIHWWDYSADIPEVMQALNDVVQQGKVLYLGISDTPAWIVSKANQYARDHGLRQFVVYQGKWSAATRDLEAEVIPMCRSEGMSIAPWGALGGGSFKTKEQREQQEGRKIAAANDKTLKISEALHKIAERKGTLMTSIAQAYVIHKYPFVIPIVGCRKVDYLKSNIAALEIELTREEIDEIEAAAEYDPGFPHNFALGSGKKSRDVSGSIGYTDLFLNNMFGTFAEVGYQQPIAISEVKEKIAKE